MLLKKNYFKLSSNVLSKCLSKYYSTNGNTVFNIPIVTKKIYSESNIEILSSKYSLIIKPYDILDCQDSNLLRFSLKTEKPEKLLCRTEIEQALDRAIKIDGEVVSINTKNFTLDQADETELQELSYLIEVPVRANLKIDSEKSVSIENLYSDKILVHTTGEGGDIKTKNLQAFQLNFEADNGNIFCDGTTLANEINLRVKKTNVSILT